MKKFVSNHPIRKPILFIIPEDEECEVFHELDLLCLELTSKQLHCISLDESNALDTITKEMIYATSVGTWLLIENCHVLKQEEMKKLSHILAEFQSESATPVKLRGASALRIYLTTYSSPTCVSRYLISNVSIISLVGYTPPTKHIMLECLDYIDPIMYNQGAHCPALWKKILFCIIIFHTVVVSRFEYASIAFTQRYNFGRIEFSTLVEYAFEIVKDFKREVEIIKQLPSIIFWYEIRYSYWSISNTLMIL